MKLSPMKASIWADFWNPYPAPSKLRFTAEPTETSGSSDWTSALAPGSLGLRGLEMAVSMYGRFPVLGVLCNMSPILLGVLKLSALLFGAYIRALDCWKLPN